MKCWSVVLLVAFASFAFADEPTNPSQALSSDLVLWSYMQQPQTPEQNQPRANPTPDPRPETQPAQNPTPAQPGMPSQNPASRSGSESQSQVAQTFTGIINKEAESFVLKVSQTTSYKLDNQEEVQQYEGKHVRITGTLDSSVNLIHVDKVEPLS